MIQDDQAQADSEDTTLVEDLGTGASNDPASGAADLAAYNAFVDGLGDDEESTQGAEPAEESTEEAEENDDAEEAEAGNGEESEESEQEEEAPSGRFRIRAKDEVEVEALALRKRHPDWSLKECIEKAENLLGVSQAQESTAETAEKQTQRSSETIAAEIAELRRKRKEANTALEFEEAEELNEQIDKLIDERNEWMASYLWLQCDSRPRSTRDTVFVIAGACPPAQPSPSTAASPQRTSVQGRPTFPV